MQVFEDALAYLVQQANPTNQTTRLPIAQALGKVLAKPLISSLNVPAFDNSQMDGYALRSEDFVQEKSYTISQRIPAGSVAQSLDEGTIARIFTGAPIPDNVDVVIMQEQAEVLDSGEVCFSLNQVQVGQAIRRAGEDVSQGEEVLPAGHRLRAEDLGLISSIGVAEVEVYQPLKIATFTTGDELLEPGQPWQVGKIYNANRYVLAGLIPQLGFELIDLGRVEDTLEATKAAMLQAAELADVVMTTGGVSVGEEDHIKPALDALGALDMWKVRMKPGKPLAFGHIQGTPFIGLPGNPVSAFATFNLFARPYLLTMQGVQQVKVEPIWVTADFTMKKSDFRREFARARLHNVGEVTQARLFSNQSSGVLTSVSWAEGFVVLPEERQIEAGEQVAFYSFNQFL